MSTPRFELHVVATFPHEADVDPAHISDWIEMADQTLTNMGGEVSATMARTARKNIPEMRDHPSNSNVVKMPTKSDQQDAPEGPSPYM